MALDKLVDSTQLNSDLTSIASAIRSKGGTEAQLSFPNGFVSAIGQITAGAGGLTQHAIYLEFEDSTNTTIYVCYDDPMIGDMITSYTPATYGQKTVSLAKLDGVTWYEPAAIPIGVELIDYTKLSADTAINSSGQAEASQWYYTSDYTEVDPLMEFEYTASLWHYVGVYDENKNVLRAVYVYNDATVDPSDSNIGHGTLSGNELTGAKYVRICSTHMSSPGMSLIRKAPTAS